MAVASHIPLPAPLRITATLAVEWKRFKGQWINYVKAAKVDKEKKDCQAAIFLACIGTDAYDVYSNMEFAEETDKSVTGHLSEGSKVRRVKNPKGQKSEGSKIRNCQDVNWRKGRVG